MKTYYVLRLQGSVLLGTMLALFLGGCKKFVQVNPPNTAIVTADVFSSNSTATAAVTAIYTLMFNNNESFAIAQDQGLLADELTNYSTQQAQKQFYTNAMTALGPNGEWTNAYKYIYYANSILSNLQNSNSVSPAVAQQLTGEAKFIRAFWHFYLTNQYGDVPLVTTIDYTKNGSAKRTAVAQVYAQIIQDLRDAEGELNANYVDVSDTTTSTERTRPCEGSAEALLSRVYLYEQKYDSAEAQASLVLNNPLYTLCTNLSPLSGANSVFLKNSKEAIWQLATPLPASVNTYDAQYFTLVSAPSTTAGNSSALSTQLLSSFEANDKRKVNWVKLYTTNTGVKYYFPYKYQAYNTSTISEYTMVLRLAEQYLIRAEARAEQKNLSGATADLNVIRNRAGLPNIADSIASSQSYLLSAISHERQVELFTEWGHRWFDLKRTGSINAVMGTPGNICQAKGGVWNTDFQLFPIPQSEILNDPNLSQNPSY